MHKQHASNVWIRDPRTDTLASERPFIAIQADLAVPDGIQGLVGEVEAILHADSQIRLTAIVNNAAIMLSPSLAETSLEAFDAYMAINVRAPFFITQQLSPHMPPGSSIVNISSASAHIDSASDIAYAMSKAAIESFTKNAAIALGRSEIRVNAVVPGFTDNGHAAFTNPAARRYMADMSVLGDVSAPSDVADAVAFLVSDKARRTTGALLDTSGGMTLHPRNRSSDSVRNHLH